MMTLGNKNELFVDGFLIESSENTELGILAPQKRETVFTFDKAWEGAFSTYYSIFQHPETKLFYLYYRGLPVLDHDGPEITCLATSEDGIHFSRVYTGEDNAVLKGMRACHNFAPFYDMNPECPKNERFKAVGFAPKEQGAALIGFYSEDGIRWSQYGSEPLIKGGGFDSLNTVFWDTETKKYRCYSRYFAEGEGIGIRAIRSCESSDFLNWTPFTNNTYNGGNAPVHHFYTNSTRPIPRAEHILAAFPMRFVENRKKTDSHSAAGLSDCVFLSSRDGYDWTVHNDRPWIYPEPDERLWTQRNFIVAAGIAETGNEFSLYVSHHYAWDDSSLVRYTVPRLRFGYVYSLDGSFVTKPFVLDGKRLTFNYNTSAVGSLFITVLDENGTVLLETEAYGNEFELPIELSEHKGKTLRLKIGLKDAYLYSIGY